jgi:hypothetical protein
MAIKELELSIPTSYADITLKKWLELQKELVNYEGDEEAVNALMFYHLCGLEPEYVRNIPVNSYAEIRNTLASFINNVELPLQKFIMIDGIEYGFEPNLSQMTYGAYADITSFKELKIDSNWSKIMSILYRPVINKKGDMYSIEPYKGEINTDKWLEVRMDVHFGALFFFVNLLMDLLKGILNYTMEMELAPNIKSILQRSGQHIPHSSNLLAEILRR